MFDLPTKKIIAITLTIINTTVTIIPAIVPDGVPLEVGVSDDKLKDVIL